MKTLFDNDPSFTKSYRRDCKGKFANALTARAEQAEAKAKMYEQMYLRELSRSRGFASIIRRKDIEIKNLKVSNEKE